MGFFDIFKPDPDPRVQAQLEQARRENQQIKTQLADVVAGIAKFDSENQALKAENAKIRKVIAHLYHFLAATQDLIQAFDARAEMVPDHLDIGKDLMESILKEFDGEHAKIKRYKKLIESQSSTIKLSTDDNGFLTEYIHAKMVSDAITNVVKGGYAPDRHDFEFDEDWFSDLKSLLRIKELGLFTIPFDLGKGVKGEHKLWIVPKC